jgi:hypothetical protein
MRLSFILKGELMEGEWDGGRRDGVNASRQEIEELDKGSFEENLLVAPSIAR